MGRTMLMVVTSCGELGETGGRTGSWLEELAAPYYAFRDSGLEVVIASPAGGEAPLDPASLEAPWVSAAGERFLADAAAMRQMRDTRSVGRVEPGEIAGLFLVGGAGAAWDFPADDRLAALIEALDRRGAPVAGVCHGVLGLTGARAASGAPLVGGRKVTGISNAEEVAVGLDGVVPILPEERLIALGGLYSKAAEPFGAHVVEDRNLFTGQNPASAGPLGAVVARATEAAPATA